MSALIVLLTISVAALAIASLRLAQRLRAAEFTLAALLPPFTPGEPPHAMIVYDVMSDRPYTVGSHGEQVIYGRNGEAWTPPEDAA